MKPHQDAAAGTLLAARVLALVELLPKLGLDADAVLVRAGLSRSALTSLEGARIHPRTEVRLWQAAEHVARDPALGLRVAKLYLDAGMPSLEGYLARNAANLRTVLNDMDRFARIVDDRMRMVLMEHGETAVIRLVRDHPPDRAQGYVEAQFAVMHAFVQHYIGPVPAWGVHLRRAKPRKLDAYREAFSGVTPRFGQAYNEIWFPRAALALPVQGADPELSAILEGHAKLLTELVPREDPFIERVRAALVSALERGRIDMEGVSRAVAISERSLRRQLCARQTTYRQLVDEARRELACKLLVEREPVQAVAERVGFRSTSAFQKAFQRWMKLSPSEYRRVAAREELVSSPMQATDGRAVRSAPAHLR